MSEHPTISAGRVAVITGAASGIGLAMAEHCARHSMRVCLCDVDEAALAAAATRIRGQSGDPDSLMTMICDVSRRESVLALHEAVLERFGAIHLLMNNAGTEGGGGLFGDPDRFARILAVNLMGVVHGCDVFVPAMINAAAGDGATRAIINTGSKQGITTPPGDTAYNISKAGVKVLTEALAHELRKHGVPISAHLLIPGFTFTGFTRVHTDVKPEAAWTPEQVIEFLIEAMTRGDFYVLCPDNDVDRLTDEVRIRWAADDIVLNRPALSRWHPDHAESFKAALAARRAADKAKP